MFSVRFDFVICLRNAERPPGFPGGLPFQRSIYAARLGRPPLRVTLGEMGFGLSRRAICAIGGTLADTRWDGRHGPPLPCFQGAAKRRPRQSA